MAPRPPVGRRMPSRLRAAAALLTVLATAASGTAGYTVRDGETLSGIAARNGVSVSAIAAANRISDVDFILAGAVLRMPSAATGGGRTPASAIHTVRAGQTLIGISQRYGVEMRSIARANRLRSYHLIYTGQRLRIPGSAVARRVVAATPAATRADVEAIIERTAARYGFKPSFVKAVAHMESGWNNRVVSSAGAVGIMQVLPSTGQFVGTYLVGRKLDLSDPEDNVLAGVAFLSHLWKLTGGDVDRVLAGYYQGLRSVSQRGMYSDTKRYVAVVKALRARFE
ncbi:MAG: LysM peptidoglycan-binding domain-containing protein [Actinomycetota bacterium]|nr:LysM peptidoglycan-binding domain-containing protein [Actinomycetota bacterium]